MAMEINEIRPDYPRQYPVVNKTEKSENDTPVNKIPQDEYISCLLYTSDAADEL